MTRSEARVINAGQIIHLPNSPVLALKQVPLDFQSLDNEVIDAFGLELVEWQSRLVAAAGMVTGPASETTMAEYDGDDFERSIWMQVREQFAHFHGERMPTGKVLIYPEDYTAWRERKGPADLPKSDGARLESLLKYLAQELDHDEGLSHSAVDSATQALYAGSPLIDLREKALMWARHLTEIVTAAQKLRLDQSDRSGAGRSSLLIRGSNARFRGEPGGVAAYNM